MKLCFLNKLIFKEDRIALAYVIKKPCVNVVKKNYLTTSCYNTFHLIKLFVV